MILFENDTDNSALVVPKYESEVPPADAVYPNSTRHRAYNKNDHRHYLTVEGLAKYNIVADADDPDSSKLIQKTTDHFYDAILILAQTTYNAQCYRLAKGYLSPYKNKVECYLEIERMLARQAATIRTFGDLREVPRAVVTETGRVKEQSPTMDDTYWLNESVQAWLHATSLDDPNLAFNPREIMWKEY